MSIQPSGDVGVECASSPRQVLCCGKRGIVKETQGPATTAVLGCSSASGPPVQVARRWASQGRPDSLSREAYGLIAPAHPILDLGREEIQRQRAWRLVRVDVLAIPLAAPDEELAAGPEGEATLQGDRNRLADHAARERLRRHSSHGAGALLGTRTDGRCSSFLTASDSPGTSSADRSARTRRPALRASDGNRARCRASTPGSAPPCTRGSTPSGPVRRSRTTPALDPMSSCSWSSYGCPPQSFSGLRPTRTLTSRRQPVAS